MLQNYHLPPPTPSDKRFRFSRSVCVSETVLHPAMLRVFQGAFVLRKRFIFFMLLLRPFAFVLQNNIPFFLLVRNFSPNIFLFVFHHRVQDIQNTSRDSTLEKLIKNLNIFSPLPGELEAFPENKIWRLY